MEDMYKEDKPNKPTYVTRTVAARKNAGLDREQEPRPARGVAERANEKEDEVEEDPINYDFEPVTAQDDHEEPPRQQKKKKTLEGGSAREPRGSLSPPP